MTDIIANFRKKFTLAILLFTAGTCHAFMYEWSAGEFTAFAALLLGIFGTADLIDKDKLKR